MAESTRAPGTLVLAPREAAEYQLFDGEGRAIGRPLRASEYEQTHIELPAVVYYVHGPGGIKPVVVGEGLKLVWDGERVLPVEVWLAELEERRVAERRFEQAHAHAHVEGP